MNSNCIARNLAVVEEHIAREATDVDNAIELYTDDIVWESPARNVILRGKDAVVDNYRSMFSSIGDIEIQPVERFATEDRVVDDAIVRFTLTGDGFVNALVPIGTRVSLRLLHIFGMRDAKIARENVYESWSTLAGKGERRNGAAETASVAARWWEIIGPFFSRCAKTLLVWQQRHRRRRELRCLLEMNDRMLADIGVNRYSVAFEARKRFWQAPGPVAYPLAPSRTGREQRNREIWRD